MPKLSVFGLSSVVFSFQAPTQNPGAHLLYRFAKHENRRKILVKITNVYRGLVRVGDFGSFFRVDRMWENPPKSPSIQGSAPRGFISSHLVASDWFSGSFNDSSAVS